MQSLTTATPMRTSVVTRAATKTKTGTKAAPAKGDPFNTLGNLKESGLIGAISPAPEGLDPFGFSTYADEMTLKRYREAELTHGRVCMLASVGMLVGEQVEGSSFLFDAQVTGPAVNHFQQVPLPFWFILGAGIALAETTRVQKGWADPARADKLFLLRDDYEPGQLGFDPLGLKSADEAEFEEARLKELSNGRLAMIAVTGMIAQELVTGLSIFPADEAFEIEGIKGLKMMEEQCANVLNENECAKNFELSLEALKKAQLAEGIYSSL